MQTTKNTQAIQTPLPVRKTSFPGSNGTGKNGSDQTGIDAFAGTGAGLHLLTKDLRSIPLFEAQLMLGGGDRDQFMTADLLSMIDTETKQLQAIEDLYSILKAQPKYKSLKDPNWSAETKPIIVLTWILRKLGALAKGDRWTVDTYTEGKKIRYRFVIYKYYHSQRVPRAEYFLPVDFLPKLKIRDQALHDIIIDAIALVSKHNKIPLWDEDGDFSNILKEMLSEPETYTDYGVLGVQRSDPRSRQREIYRKGPPAEYLALIKKRRKIITAAMLCQQVNKYKKQKLSGRKELIMWWVELAMRLSFEAQSVEAFTYIPNYYKSRLRAISPFRMYKFIWSAHGNDVLKKKAMYDLSRDDKLGMFVPVSFTITNSGEKIKPLPQNNFPERLVDWFKAGNSNFLGRFMKYFYSEILFGQQTPVEVFLEKIEAAQLKNQTNDRHKNKSKAKSKKGNRNLSR